ncbi:MAG: type IV pilus twitching motility protein PilT [Fimbriimonadaceae bacterium]|nr:type IV pilus twitching motility protein PilT [Fimbriimonadaceae bacterium]QYK54726.1 MAG: type IV pilus twitching motility protein PilT [Fimbriimonadaceae bacterium]
MANEFSWDKVLGEGGSGEVPPPVDSEAELEKILSQIGKLTGRSDEPGEEETTPGLTIEQADTLASHDARIAKSIENPTGEHYVPAAIPRDLVEPVATHIPTHASDEDEFGAPPPGHEREPNKSNNGKYHVDSLIQQPTYHKTTDDMLPLKEVHLDEILKAGVERKASDIHITTGLPPMVRVDGEIIPLPYEVVNPETAKRLIYEVLTDEHLQKFEQTRELDFAYTAKAVARFRVNVYMQRGSVAAALRMIPNRIPSYDDLKLPSIIRDIAKRTSGLILVTGPTGSGKSTTIAAMLDDINAQLQGHIMTIEDPIEYLHRHKKCMVNQREMHADTYSFHNALRAVLREDPDIILVGELRDLETIEAALTLAETGHLVFGTLHTRNAPSTIDRVVDVFPSDQQDQIRVLLANTIEGVIAQQLLPKLGGGRCAALEIMIGIPAIRNLIREAKTHQMYSVIETNRQIGMQTMDSHLAELFRTGQVSYEECLMRAVDKETFARLAKNVA